MIFGKEKKIKILIVEDEEDVAKALKLRLKANGYHPMIATDSIQGVTMAHKDKPDLVILDIMLPGGGGFAVAERLKQATDTRHIPIIILTGISGIEEKAHQIGAAFYLRKPYEPEELLDAIKKALKK